METAIRRILNFITGVMWIYEHHFNENLEKERVCENCHEVVKNNTPCMNSRYYTTWVELNKVKKFCIELSKNDN